jgi:FKBP-type peptidyl-prolyl cis-trans isomerase
MKRLSLNPEIKNKLKKPLFFAAPILVAFLLFLYIMDTTSPTTKDEKEANAPVIESSNQNDTTDTTSTSDTTPSSIDAEELIIEDEVKGTGDEVKKGDTVSVNYIGTLLDGTKFDSSYDRGTPLVFTVGEGKVIEGWEQGLVGMKVGGKRRLTIPSKLGYGDAGYPPDIPAKAGLIFDIELLEIKK